MFAIYNFHILMRGLVLWVVYSKYTDLSTLEAHWLLRSLVY